MVLIQLLYFLMQMVYFQPTYSVPDFRIYQFEDDFETVGLDLYELFPEGDCSFKNNFEALNQSLSSLCRWTAIQQVNPSHENNEITLDDEIVLKGSHSLKLLARATGDSQTFSKMDIEKGGMYFQVGVNVRIEADFYIASEENIENLLLLDIEGCQLWDSTVDGYDESSPENQCPGVRLIMKNNDYLSIDRGKIGGTTMTQTQMSFPRNQWVNVVWDMLLSDKQDDDVGEEQADGINKLYINNQEILSKKGMNMANADVFRGIFAAHSIDFELQLPLYYQRVQIGVTANPTPYDITVYIDNFKLKSYKNRH